MKEANKTFLEIKCFAENVEGAMRQKGIDYEELCALLNNEVGYKITKSNLKMYVKDRVPNTNFLIALSIALGVSTDYLLGLDKNQYLFESFCYDYNSNIYKMYLGGKYNAFFYETKDSSESPLIKAIVTFEYTNKMEVTMTIRIDNTEKIYKGELIINKSNVNGFITLKGVNLGEVVTIAFYTPQLNLSPVKLIVGAMVSISSGDLKRAPVMSRIILVNDEIEINEKNEKFLKSQLMLNSKYISIEQGELDIVFENLRLKTNSELEEKIKKRLLSAFNSKVYYSIEDNYIANTLKKDYKISQRVIAELLADLRLNSMNCTNNKVSRKLDSLTFEMINNLNKPL